VPKILGVVETALYVDDMRRSVDFYEHVLGLEVLDFFDRLTSVRVAPNQVLLIFKKGASIKATVRPFGTIPPTDGNGQLHLALGIALSEREEWRDRLAAHGIPIESEFEWPEGGWSIYVRDPDGHAIELKTSDWRGTPLE
jgi:catechol 2,3-dioxygenase-like lactoylglutathione lyase family enzyme